jgi:hypothetical protein
VALPAPALPAQANDTDYVVARHAALLNGITTQPQGCYMFLQAGDSPGADREHPVLHQLGVGEPGKPPQLLRIAGKRPLHPSCS